MKIEELIAKFQAIKEELSKNVNMSYSNTPNNGSLMMSDDKADIELAEEIEEKVLRHMKRNKKEEKKEGHDLKIDKGEKSPHLEPKAHEKKIEGLIMHGLKKNEDLEKGKGGETKHDRCAREVKEKNPSVSNAHAVCVAAGVRPEKWKHVSKEEELHLSKNGQWSLGLKKADSTNEKAATSKPHNKGKFKVMDMTDEKESPHAEAEGEPYNGDRRVNNSGGQAGGERKAKAHESSCKKI